MISQNKSSIEKCVIHSLDLFMQDTYPEREYECSTEGNFFSSKKLPCAIMTLAGFDFKFSLLSKFCTDFYNSFHDDMATTEGMKEKLSQQEHLLDLVNRFSSGFKRTVEQNTPYVGISTPRPIQSVSEDAFAESNYSCFAHASIYVDNKNIISAAAFLYAGEHFVMPTVPNAAASTPSFAEDDMDDDFIVF